MSRRISSSIGNFFNFQALVIMDDKESNEGCPKEAGSEIAVPSAPNEQAASLWPETSVTERENKDISVNCDSPVAEVNEACRLTDTSVSVNPASPRTPDNGIFYPFAPAPESLGWAPVCKKYTDRPLRMLRYGSFIEDGNLDSDLEQEILDLLYESLLEFIVSTHMEEISSALSDFDKSRTPLAPRLRAAADTCPGAPMKRPAKARNTQFGLCRKLF